MPQGPSCACSCRAGKVGHGERGQALLHKLIQGGAEGADDDVDLCRWIWRWISPRHVGPAAASSRR